MRTTLTLDDDLAEALNRKARLTGRSFKAVVHSNDSDFNRFAGLRWSNPLR